MKPQIFTSFDEYAAALGHSSLRITALGRDRAPWTMGCWQLDDIRVRWAQDGGPCFFEALIGAEGAGLLTCVGDATCKVSGNGVRFGASSVMAIPGRTEIQSVSFDAVAWYSVFIPASRLYEPAETTVRPRRIPCGVINTPPANCQRFRETLRRVVAAARAGAFETNLFGRRMATQQLVAAARNVLWPAAAADIETIFSGRPRIPRLEIIRRVQQLLDQRTGEPVALDDLALTAGVSNRTLHNTFHEQFGLSPKRFLRLRTLNAARQALSRSDPNETCVTDIVTKLGVWEWGRFARDYRALFGELPSQTLRRAT